MRRVLLWLLILPAVPAAAVGAERFNVDFGVGWQGCYRPLEWTPVEIGISSRLSKPFGGALTISAQQDELSTLTISHPIVLTRDLRLYLPLVTKFAFSGEDCVVRITDERGRVRWRRSYSLWDSPGGPQGLNAVGTNELLIGVSGQMLFGLAFLPKHSKCRSGEQTGKVHVKLKLERLLPWDWTGYVSLDLLVLYNVDWSLLRSEQVEAIVEWISNGGRLLLVLGSHPLPAKHPLAALLPLPLGQPTQVEIDRNTLTRWGVRKTRKRTVTCWLRHDSPGDRRSITAPPIFAHGPVGFGHVGVFGADPSVLGGEQKGNLAPFWIAHVKPLLCGRTLKAGSAEDSEESDDYYPYTYQLGDAGAGSDAVLNHLLNVKQLRPISIWWVVLLLVTLAVLLGPVDYLVLKRFGRLPLTWVTSACYVALFSVGAYYGVRALRGGRLQVRVVSVSDGIAGQETAWSTRYSGIFAPAGHDYKLAGLGPRDWWSGIAPHGGYLEEEHTWGRRQIYCLQHDGANSVTSVPISIWSMQCLVCEAPVPALPIGATIKRQQGELMLALTNRSSQQISGGSVRMGGNKLMRFGSVSAGATREIRVRLRKGEPWDACLGDPDEREYYLYGSYGSRPFHTDAPYFAQGSLRRTRGIEEHLERGAAVVCVRYDDAPVPFTMADRSCDYSHIKLLRLVVFPED